MLRSLTTWDLPVGLRNLPDAVHRFVVVPLQRRRARRSAIGALESMSDLLLADIGLSRNDIPEAVDGMLARTFPDAAPQPPVAAARDRSAEIRLAA